MIIKNSNTASGYGVLLKEALKNRGIPQKQFAEVFGIKESNLSGIINGKRKIPVGLIPTVAELIGVDESDIINYQSRPKASGIPGASNPQEKEAATLLDEFGKLISVTALLKGLVKPKDTAINKLNCLREEFGLSMPVDLQYHLHQLSERCFRRSDKTGLDTTMIATWVVRARAKAAQIKVSNTFHPDAIPELAQKLSKVLHTNLDTENEVKALLNEYGIGYCHIPKESKASIDGYSFLIGKTPFIAVTKRFDRIDNYAFNLMHELGHIYLGHLEGNTGMINIVLSPEDETNQSERETDADRFATDNLISNRDWLLAPPVILNPFIIQKAYTKWAKSKGYNPWIVLGRVSHETGMYRFTSDTSRRIHTKVRKEVVVTK